MIENFKHKGLKRLYEKDDRSKLPPEMVERIRDILFYLDTAVSLENINRPTFRLHPLKGNRKGQYAVDVQGAGSRAYRISFQRWQCFRREL